MESMVRNCALAGSTDGISHYVYHPLYYLYRAAWRKKPFGSRVCGAFWMREMQGFFIIWIGILNQLSTVSSFYHVVGWTSVKFRGIRGSLFLLNMCIIGSSFVSGGWLRCFVLSVCSDAVVAFCYCWFNLSIISFLNYSFYSFSTIPLNIFPVAVMIQYRKEARGLTK